MKLLGRIHVCGMYLPVYEVTAEERPDLAEHCAVFENESILVHAGTAQGDRRHWFTHEALHAVIDKSGLLHATAAAFGEPVDSPRMEAWEEAMVRMLTPHLIETFANTVKIWPTLEGST